MAESQDGKDDEDIAKHYLFGCSRSLSFVVSWLNDQIAILA